MATYNLPETPQPYVSPALLVGVASPLWTYFGAAAVGGVAYWWLTQWTRPANLEALVGGKAPAEVSPILKPVLEVVETGLAAVAATQEAAVEALAQAAPLPAGREAAPISPPVEIAVAPVAPAEAASAPESLTAPAPSPAVAPEPKPIVEAKPPENTAPEPTIRFATVPERTISEAGAANDLTAKPRVKKVPPAAPEA